MLRITNGTMTDAFYDLLLHTLREVIKASAATPKQIKPITTQHPKHLHRWLNLLLQTDLLFLQ
jgi:hypothetical protein